MDNLYFDISGPVLLAADSPIEAEFVWTLRNVGIDHVLLGSDYPQMGLDDAMDALEKLDLTDEEKATIRAGNALKLLGRQERACTTAAIPAKAEMTIKGGLPTPSLAPLRDEPGDRRGGFRPDI